MSKLTRIVLATSLALGTLAAAAPAQAGGYGGDYGGSYGGYSSGYGYGSGHGYGYDSHAGHGYRKCYWDFQRYYDDYRHAWLIKKVYVCH